MKVAFWGRGRVAQDHLPQIKERIARNFSVFFTDNDVGGDEQFFEGFHVVHPDELESHVDYICILSRYEWAIRKQIFLSQLFPYDRILRFHEINRIIGSTTDVTDPIIELKEFVADKKEITDWVEFQNACDYIIKKYSSIFWRRKEVSVVPKKQIGDFRPIWCLWLQGYAFAPKIVKACIDSIKKVAENTSEAKYIFLDRNNVNEFIDLPQYIMDKYEQGIISNTHMSDIIRSELLFLYGGVWIDATVLATGESIPQYLMQGCFMYSDYNKWFGSYHNNYLISCDKGDLLTGLLNVFLKEYWKKEDRVVHYHIMGIFWTIAENAFPEEAKCITSLPATLSLLLSKVLSMSFDRNKYDAIKTLSDFHKLSYKMDLSALSPDSFVMKIIS